MGETLESTIKCVHCGNEVKLVDTKNFEKKIECNKCHQIFDNHQLENWLNEFAETNFGKDIEYHIEDGILWLDTKKAAKYLGFYNKSKAPNIVRVRALLNNKSPKENTHPLIQIPGEDHKIGTRWKILGSSLYYFRREYQIEKDHYNLSETSKILGISTDKVKKLCKEEKIIDLLGDKRSKGKEWKISKGSVKFYLEYNNK
jgi:hypothetical protein